MLLKGSTQAFGPGCEFIHKGLLAIAALILILGCQANSCMLEPNICYIPQQRQIEGLPSAFEPLTPFELKQDWGKEMQIAQVFAKEFDLYRAITSYKRALILIPCGLEERRLEIQYKIIQSYYLGQKYQEAIEEFEKSDLAALSPDFPATGDLLIILYDSYKEIEQEAKAEKVGQLIEKYNPQAAQDLNLSSALNAGNLREIEAIKPCSRFETDLDNFLGYYADNKRSVRQAQVLNAILPGAGYYYVGQKKSALTSFLINALFIAAAYQFFDRGDIAAGIITTSFEAGWYFGGINGAGLAAKEWNEAVYQNTARDLMVKNRLFPSLMLETAF